MNTNGLDTTVPSDLITLPEAARLAGLSQPTLRRAVNSGRVRAFRKLGRFWLSRADVLGMTTEYQPKRPAAEVSRKRMEEWTDRTLREAGIR